MMETLRRLHVLVSVNCRRIFVLFLNLGHKSQVGGLDRATVMRQVCSQQLGAVWWSNCDGARGDWPPHHVLAGCCMPGGLSGRQQTSSSAC